MLPQITSLQHPLVKHVVKLRESRSYRYTHQHVVVEGIKPISEILSHAVPIQLIATDFFLFPSELESEKILVSPSVMQKISGMENPEGLLAVFQMPSSSSLNGLKKILALDGINDPGNLGTLVRTALALGWGGIFLIGDNCDPFNEKALRAARGATFRISIDRGSWEKAQQLIKDSGLIPLASDAQGRNLQEISCGEGIFLVMGNEANGVSEAIKQNCALVSIPMPGEMESLNVSVAGGILMYML